MYKLIFVTKKFYYRRCRIMLKTISELIKAVELGMLLIRLDKEGKIESVILEQDRLKILVRKDKILNSELEKLIEYGFKVE